MPAARDSILDAACAALLRRPWSAVRMGEVAAAAGVSRQTLYNEFGGKDGLARALVRREIDDYLAGVQCALAGAGDAAGSSAGRGGPTADHGDPLAAVAEWTVAAARDSAVVRAVLTGCWGEGLPAPALGPVPSSPSATPAQRRADGPLPSPGELVALVRDRAAAAPAPPGTPRTDTADRAGRCELAVRLALSWVVAPPADGTVAELVRGALTGPSA